MKKARIGLATVVLSLGMAGVVSAEEVKPLSDPDNIYEGYGWTWPTSGTGFSTISGEYGERRTGERNPYHVGIDIAVNEKPVYAVADGEVVMSGKFSDGAQVIVIEHDDTAINGTPLYTRYLHLKLGSRLVDQYDSVSEGERIATSGNTGGVKAHLHFDINEDEDTSPEFNDSVEDTIDPAYFWPYMLDSFALAANGQGEADEHNHDDHSDYDDPDKYFDQILINYVGEKKFDKWFDALDESERTVTKLKSDFNISDDDVEKIFKEAKEKAKKKRK